MIKNTNFSLPFSAASLGVAAILTLISPVNGQIPAVSVTEAQVSPVPTDVFAFEIGRAAKAGTVYSINATQPATSKLTGQKIRLKIVDKTGLDTTTRYFTFATGKYKTVGQLDAMLVEIFRRFLATPSPGQEIGKIGDVKHGGEVRFVVTSADILRFDNVSPDEPVRASDYSRTDVEGLLTALTGPH